MAASGDADSSPPADPKKKQVQLPTVEVNTDFQKAVRFPAWVALACFSAVCLAAVTSDNESRGSKEKFVVSVTAISMSLAFLTCCGYLFARDKIMDTVTELGILAIVAGLWGVGFPFIMGPVNRIAVVGTVVQNANLYFFSWISLAVVIYLVHSWLQTYVGIDVRKTPKKQARWFYLLAASLVVMSAAIRIFRGDDDGCKDDPFSDTKFCKRTKFAISLGALSCVASSAMAYLVLHYNLTAVAEVAITATLSVLWTFGVGYITFGGSSSPGTTIGNLYFSTWISFIVSVVLFGGSVRGWTEQNGAKDSGTAPNSPQQQPDEEIEA